MRAVLLVCLLLLPPGLLPSAASGRSPVVLTEAALGERLDAVVGARAFRGARVAALVVRQEDGEVLYGHSPDQLLIPASNQKILTALAALATFGPTHQFETQVLANGPPDADGAVGDLVIRGGGDPVLNSEDLWKLAAGLRKLGLRRVRGDIVLDDSAFDRERHHPSWGKVSARPYHAPVGALTTNYGAFTLLVQPGARRGEPSRVTVDPPIPYFHLTNRVETGSTRAQPVFQVDRHLTADGERIRVRGVARAGDASERLGHSVLDPARYTGAVLRMQLEGVGVALEGGLRTDVVPDGATLLYTYRGRRLSEIVRLLMKYSSNPIAEMLVKAMGAHATGGIGSWKTGIEAMRGRLVSLGLPAAGLELVDGSGLSRENKVTPRVLTGALRLASDSFYVGPEFVSSLPIAFVDGTLEDRAEQAAGEIRAKTGTLDGVTALSGFARMSDGEVAAFSILVNGYRGSDRAVRDAVDRFGAVLVEWSASPPLVPIAGQERRARSELDSSP